MRTRSFCAIALSGLGIGLTAASAAANPLVIPGIGPEEARRIVDESVDRRRAAQHQAAQPAPQTVYRRPAPQAYQHPAAPRTAAQGSYGGGFLELLITGRDPTPDSRVIYNQPPQAGYDGRPAIRRMSYAPEPLARVAREPDARFARQEVDYAGPHAPGTVVVDTPGKYLYLVTGNGRAMRYGIGVGRPGFEWSGVKSITRKAEWPDWTPPPEMLKRRPDLPKHMSGGPDNPLGARALYLGSSLYRIHGTNEPHTIGQNVSSGCIRMMNSDVEDLYGRVRVGTKVIVI
jgi:lipoprotein-anchoring transpeptidase ErfK/SrfK